MAGVHLDFHPEEPWLATASHDSQICVWDLSQENHKSAIHTLKHPESVASIKWRPKHRTQIAACSLTAVFDPHLYVWDLKRPCVPYASFDSLTNKVQSI